MTFDRLFRDPLTVPTPVAIALADFCRRAERPASSAEVRLALSSLPAEDDAEFAAYCAGEPPARPLSPLATVDVFRGRPAQEAARLEEEGHYRRVASALERLPVAPLAPGEGAPVRAQEKGAPSPAAAAPPDASPKRRKSKGAAASPEPIRRSREEVALRRLEEEKQRATGPEETPPPPPRPGRTPAAPQFGRFVGGPAARRPLRELATEELAEMIDELRANRRGILERLDAVYARDEREALTPADLNRLLQRHGLVERFARAERDNLKTLLRQNRGFLPPIRRALGMTAPELRRAIARYDLESELREWQERLREEARTEAPLVDKLALAIARTEPLRAAGVLDDLDGANLEALGEALRAAAAKGATQDPTVVVELARRELGIDPRPWRKAVAHYGLIVEAAGILGVPPPEPARPTGEAAPRSAARSDRPRPAGGDRFPRTDRPRPAGSDRFPRTDRTRPAGGDRFPRTDRPNPTSGDRFPRTDRPRPTGGDRFQRTDRPRTHPGDRFGAGSADRPRGKPAAGPRRAGAASAGPRGGTRPPARRGPPRPRGE